MSNHSTRTDHVSLLSALRDDLRVRREARDARRTLRRELATYTSATEVNDLYAAIGGRQDADAEELRTLLARNTAQPARHQLAS